MKRSWLVGVSAVVLVLAVLGLSGCGAGGTTLGGGEANLRVNLSSQQEGIWVSGQGEVMAVPDLATLRLGIEAQEASVEEAQTQASEAMDRVMNALADSGVDEKDIQTQYFNIQRVTRWNNIKEEEEVIGYRVSNIVTAKIRNLDDVGDIIDRVAAAGGDLTRIDNISFTVEDPSVYQQEAREEAMADARAKAEQMANLAGMKLGNPTYISESTYIPSPIYRTDVYAEAAQAAGAPAVETPISPGEMEIRLTVQVAYEMLD